MPKVPSAGNILTAVYYTKEELIMRIKKFSLMLLGTVFLAALLIGCSSDNKEGNPGGVAKVDEALCVGCHSSWQNDVNGRLIVSDYMASKHHINDAAGCQDCHGGGAMHNGVGPLPYPDPSAAGRCNLCHNDMPAAGHAGNPATSLTSPGFVNNCTACHNPHNPALFYGAGCIDCHAVAQAQVEDGLVNDNNGVRASSANSPSGHTM